MIADKSLQAASNLVAIFIGVLGGLALADFEGLEVWLYSWQTMVAGCLAVFAAFITVLQMGRVDEKQQRRHEQTIAFNLRADALRMHRAAVLVAKPLREWAAEANSRLVHFDNQLAAGGPSLDEVEAAELMASKAKQIIEPMNSPALAAAADLLSPRAVVKVAEIQGAMFQLGSEADAAIGNASRFRQRLESGAEDQDVMNLALHLTIDGAKALRIRLIPAIAGAAVLAGHIESTTAHYRRQTTGIVEFE